MIPANTAGAIRVPAWERRTGRLLLAIPILVASVLGLITMGSRFVSVLHESLKQSPENWQGIALLAVLIGAAGVIIVAACAAVGAVMGVLLRACFAWWIGTPIRRQRV